MDPRQIFLVQHERVHSSAMAGPSSGSHVIDGACEGLSDTELRRRLSGHTSIAWLLWHMARCEDVAVNLVLRRVPEVCERGGWPQLLGVDARDIGTGMSNAEVDEFDSRVNLGALNDYRDAVGAETRNWLAEMDLQMLSESYLDAGQCALAAGALGPRAEWVVELWDGRTCEWFLSWLAIGHNYWHIAEISHIRRLMGHAGK
jgi:hypothetical protein